MARADSKLTQLSTDTTPSLTNVLYEVKNPATTDTSMQVPVRNILTLGTTWYIRNGNALQTGTTFYVSSGTVQGIFTIQQPDNDTTDPPIEIKTLTTTEGAANHFHSAFLYGKIPNDGVNFGEFVLTVSSDDLPVDPGASGLSLRPEIALESGSGPTGFPRIDFRAYAAQFPNGNTGNDMTVTPGTVTVFGELLIADPLGGSGQLTLPSSLASKSCLGTNAGGVVIAGTCGGSGGLPLPGGATNYIQSTNSLQSGATFYVSSGTVNGQLSVGINSTTPSFMAVGSAEDSNSILSITNNYSTPGHYLGFFKALAPNMPAGTSFGYYFTWGVGDSNYDRAFVNYNYVGHNNTLNSVDFGFFGIASVLSYFANNRVGIGTGSGIDPGATLHISPDVSTTKPLIVQGASSQSADLTEWQDSSANILSSVKADGGFAPWSRTKAQLQALSPTAAGEIYYCSDCSTDGVVVSTGTAAGSVARISARTTVIN